MTRTDTENIVFGYGFVGRGPTSEHEYGWIVDFSRLILQVDTMMLY